MSRLMLNWSEIRVLPAELCDVISLTSAMEPRCRSRGVATLVAMVSGLVPGMFAVTEMAGKSVFGRGATGRRKKATMPASATPAVNRDVAIGLEMKRPGIFMLG